MLASPLGKMAKEDFSHEFLGSLITHYRQKCASGVDVDFLNEFPERFTGIVLTPWVDKGHVSLSEDCSRHRWHSRNCGLGQHGLTQVLVPKE